MALVDGVVADGTSVPFGVVSELEVSKDARETEDVAAFGHTIKGRY